MKDTKEGNERDKGRESRTQRKGMKDTKRGNEGDKGRE